MDKDCHKAVEWKKRVDLTREEVLWTEGGYKADTKQKTNSKVVGTNHNAALLAPQHAIVSLRPHERHEINNVEKTSPYLQ